MLKTEFILSLTLEERELFLESIMEKFSTILENHAVQYGKSQVKYKHWLIPSKWDSVYETASFDKQKLHITFLATTNQQKRMHACIVAIAEAKKAKLNVL